MPDALPPEPPDLNDAAYQRVLAILLDVGTSIVLELKSPSKDTTLAARAVAFKQLDEAIRRTILLSRHIAEHPLHSIDELRAAKRTAARRQVIRTVEDNIHRHARPADAPSLRIELLDRLDSIEFIDDLDNRSPADLITELCRDLGLVTALPGIRPALRRTPDDIAILCAQAAATPGSGLPQWLAATHAQAAANDASSRPSVPLSPRERAGVRVPPHTDPPPPS